jgi:hypothetical protein
VSAFQRAYADERRTFEEARKAHWQRRRAEWRFRDRLRDWGVSSAISRLMKAEADAEDVHDLKAGALKDLWRRIAPQLKPVGCTLTDADGYRRDVAVSHEVDALAVEALLHACLVDDPDGLYRDGKVPALNVIDHCAVPTMMQAGIISSDDGMYLRGLVDARVVVDLLLLRPIRL